MSAWDMSEFQHANNIWIAEGLQRAELQDIQVLKLLIIDQLHAVYGTQYAQTAQLDIRQSYNRFGVHIEKGSDKAFHAIAVVYQQRHREYYGFQDFFVKDILLWERSMRGVLAALQNLWNALLSHTGEN